MKKIIVLSFIAAAALSSCKKAYTCACVTTYYYNGNHVMDVETGVAYRKTMTKKTAVAACEHEAASLDKNAVYAVGNDPAFTTNVTCTLKE
jgi:hypothetical protein